LKLRNDIVLQKTLVIRTTFQKNVYREHFEPLPLCGFKYQHQHDARLG